MMCRYGLGLDSVAARLEGAVTAGERAGPRRWRCVGAARAALLHALPARICQCLPVSASLARAAPAPVGGPRGRATLLAHRFLHIAHWSTMPACSPGRRVPHRRHHAAGLQAGAPPAANFARAAARAGARWRACASRLRFAPLTPPPSTRRRRLGHPWRRWAARRWARLCSSSSWARRSRRDPSTLLCSRRLGRVGARAVPRPRAAGATDRDPLFLAPHPPLNCPHCRCAAVCV